MRSCLLFFCLLSACQIAPQKGGGIKPTEATSAVQGSADACAIWIAKDDPKRSTIIGNDKTKDGALYVWVVSSGQEIYRKLLDRPGNPSVRQGVVFDDRVLDIVGCPVHGDNTIRLFSVDVAGRSLVDVTSPKGIATEMDELAGFCLYLRPDDGRLFAFVSEKKKGADIHQIELLADGTGKSIRSFGGPDQLFAIEAMVADDELGFLYCMDEAGGVLKFHADPRRGDDDLISHFAEGESASSAPKGLALYLEEQGGGYLVLSPQDDNALKIYTRGTNELVQTVVTGGPKRTDAVAISSTPIQPYFPQGILVRRDVEKNRFVAYSWKVLGVAGQ